ncbi:MAG: glycosyltransferase [Planctomycetes bacterium]|nr:glycosyltransferase [Planctomycetota bacterium]
MNATLREIEQRRAAATGLPMISVVTPSYNQGAFLERCIRSVLEQRYPNFEHIVYDNCSDDGTVDVLQGFEHLDWTREPDDGQSDAVNKAIRKARGEIIAWINADDSYEPGAFAIAARELSADTGLKAVAGRVHVVDPDGKITETSTPRFEGLDYLVEFWNGGYGLGQPGVFFRRELVEELGPLRTDLHYAMDYDFWLRVARRYPFKIIDEVIARYVVHPASKTGQAHFGSGFNEELERVSRLYWGRRGSRRYRRLARGCDRFVVNCCLNAIVYAHRTGNKLDWAALRRLLRRRPAALFGRHFGGVLAERVLGNRVWGRLKTALRIAERPRSAEPTSVDGS